MTEGQVALVRANTQYGQVLNELFQLEQSDTKKVFTVFDSLQDAKKYAESFLNKTDEYEFVIYNSKNEVLAYLDPKSF